MLDFVTDALVLKKEPIGDYDALYTLFTIDRGKVAARATSARKIISKLAAHLEPGLLSRVRLVTRKNTRISGGTRFQIADALAERRLFADFTFLELVDGMLLLSHADPDLWNFLLTGNPEKKKMLSLCGFGEEQMCASCGLRAVVLYHPDQAFLCLNCSSEIPKKLVTYL